MGVDGIINIVKTTFNVLHMFIFFASVLRVILSLTADLAVNL